MIINWPKHIAEQCKHGSDYEGACCVLFTCAACGASEGELPTDCPGFRLSYAARLDIYEGRLDYNRKDGWVTLKHTAIKH